MEHIYHTTECHCPNCNHPINAATSADGQVGAPQKDDISLCLNCGTVLQFDGQLKLQAMSYAALSALPTDVQDDIACAQQHIKAYLQLKKTH